MIQATASADAPRNSLLMVAAGGVLSGILTPLMVPLIDRIGGGPGDFRIALVAIPTFVDLARGALRHSVEGGKP